MKNEEIIRAADQWHKDLLAVEREKTARRRMTLNGLGALFLAMPILILLWPTLSSLNFACFAEAVSGSLGVVSAACAVLMLWFGGFLEHPDFCRKSALLLLLGVFLFGIWAAVPSDSCPVFE